MRKSKPRHNSKVIVVVVVALIQILSDCDGYRLMVVLMMIKLRLGAGRTFPLFIKLNTLAWQHQNNNKTQS